MKITKANVASSVQITFQIAYSYDSTLNFNYAVDYADTVRIRPDQSKTVSGIDPKKPIAFTLVPIVDYRQLIKSKDNNKSYRNTYVMSMIRLPYLYTSPVDQLSKPVVVKVYTPMQIEFWYVFGLRKVYEPVKSQKIRGLVIAESGIVYNKELYRVVGNIPAELVRSLNINKSETEYLHSLAISYPTASVNNAKTRVLSDSSEMNK
ncbi:hypothetical protein SlGVgp008 [Spodoptera litura granulovirus]|uniref:Uncharacterized protein n=1 Tax=Spodoptera litura granulovirus TaxID=359919 RepID=A5IZL0_9BBAC|nr:hypothetical protein SlGVgp008 [Spodoptera litura granulovirus]ABQ51951.1 hypothetical protein SlGVgp008 [Spodoptera litura granulovirus]